MDRVYIVLHKPTGCFLLMGADEVAAKLGVEPGYIDWAIREDRAFENGDWVVW